MRHHPLLEEDDMSWQATWARLVERFLAFIPKMVVSVVIFFIGLYVAGWLARLLAAVLRRRKVDPELALLAQRVTRWSLIGLAALVALQQIGFDVTAFLTGLGILGFTVGFALQDISRNLVAGLLLLLMQPFDIGDAVEVQGYAGVVEDVDLRATALRTWDGRLVLIPNADVFTTVLVNFTKTPKRRVEVQVGVAYDSDLDKVEQVALDAVRGLPGVVDDPAPFVIFHTFGESSIDLTVYFWVDTQKASPFAAKSDAVRAIHKAFAEAGIDIPFPIRTVFLQKEAD